MTELDLTQYASAWSGYIGNEQVVRQLRLGIASARARRTAMDHVLLTGAPGTGKTALALLAARELTKGRKKAQWRLIQPPITWVQFVNLLGDLADGDALVVDEAHRLTEGGRKHADFWLSYLQDFTIVTARGVVPMPKVTVLAATTDPQKIPPAILSRFTVPGMEPYSDEEAARIVMVTARKMFNPLGLTLPSKDNCAVLAGAACNNPRAIRRLLGVLRDLAITKEVKYEKGYDVSLVLAYADTTADGLGRTERTYLLKLLDLFGGKAGIKTIQGTLGVPLDDAERVLLDRGLITRTASGREITTDGIKRAKALREEWVKVA